MGEYCIFRNLCTCRVCGSVFVLVILWICICVDVVCIWTRRDVRRNHYNLSVFLYIFGTNGGAGIWTNRGVGYKYYG